MNLKSKMRNYGFWVAIISAVLMVLQALGMDIDIPVVKEVLISICGILVMLGIISNPEKGKGFVDTEKEEKN